MVFNFKHTKRLHLNQANRRGTGTISPATTKNAAALSPPAGGSWQDLLLGGGFGHRLDAALSPFELNKPDFLSLGRPPLEL
jgi:hypothetical protein